MKEKITKLMKIVLSDKPFLSKKLLGSGLLLLQAIFGLLWIEGSMWKIMIDGKFALNYDGLRYWVSKGSEFPVLDIYKKLIDGFIIPNIKVFIILVFITEFTIGILYIFGKYVRLASLLALGQTIAITLSVLHAPHEWKWSYFLMMLVSIIFILVPTTSKWPNKLLKRT